MSIDCVDFSEYLQAFKGTLKKEEQVQRNEVSVAHIALHYFDNITLINVLGPRTKNYGNDKLETDLLIIVKYIIDIQKHHISIAIT